MSTIAPDDPLSLKEAAETLLRGLVTASTLRAAADRGNLEVERLGRRIVVTPRAIEAWRAKCRVKAEDRTCSLESGATAKASGISGTKESVSQQELATAILNGLAQPSAAYIAKTATPNFGDGDPNRVKVGAVIALYARDKVASTARPKETVARLKRLNGFFGDDFVFSITPPRCKAYVDSRGTVQGARRELEDLRAAIQYAYKSRLLTVPVPVDMPAKADPRERWLTRSEAARLLLGALGFKLARMSHFSTSNDAGKRDIGGWRIVGRPGERNRHVARFILIGLYTGTRHDAILGLGWLPQIDGGHVDLEQGLIYRRGAGERVTKKRRPPVPIDDRLAAHLRRWAKMPANGRYVVTYDGSRMDRMQRSWRSARALAGLDEAVTPHVLRHTYVTWQLQAGEDAFKVAGRAGMDQAMIERVYGHHSLDYLRTNVKRG